APAVFIGVALGLAVGKPIGIIALTWAATKARIALLPSDAGPLGFLGMALLCGIGDLFSLLMADQAFGGSPYATVAKIGVLAGSVLAATLGAVTLSLSPVPVTAAEQP